MRKSLPPPPANRRELRIRIKLMPGTPQPGRPKFAIAIQKLHILNIQIDLLESLNPGIPREPP